MFHDEVDLLRFRLREYMGVVDRTLVVESASTFRGGTKPQVAAGLLSELHGLVSPACEVHVVRAELPQDLDSAWVRERAQRRALLAAVARLAGDDDVVVIGDVDEIAFREVSSSFATRSPDTAHPAAPARCGARPKSRQELAGCERHPI